LVKEFLALEGNSDSTNLLSLVVKIVTEQKKFMSDIVVLLLGEIILDYLILKEPHCERGLFTPL